MDLSLSMQSVKHLFSFPFHDPNWKNKLLIGAGLTFAGMIIPILPWLVVSGYFGRMLRAGAKNEDAAHLPEWDHWGDLFLDGLRMLGVSLLFGLPAMLVMGFGWVFYMVTVVGSINNGRAMSGADGMLMMSGMMIFFLTFGIGMLLSLASFIFMPPAQAHVIVHERFGALLDVRGWWQALITNFGSFMLAVGVFYGLLMLAMFVFQIFYMTLILCFVAPLLMAPFTFYAGLVFYRLAGQAYGAASPTQADTPAVLPSTVGAG